jgi:hypothetical protein
MPRVFLSQSRVDAWATAGLVEVDGENLTVKAGCRSFELTAAALVRRVSDDGPDPNGLVGKVRTEAALAAGGVELYMTSGIKGETAYDVEPGFLAEVAAGQVAAVRGALEELERGAGKA